jgi:deoxyribodipyrimidine photolyase-related protein
MRHFRDAVQDAGLPLTCLALDALTFAAATLPERLALEQDALQPQALWVCEPGEWRLQHHIAATAQAADVPPTWCEDSHFLCSRARFARWGDGRKEWHMAHFYRAMRREHRVLMDGDEPLAGQ